MASPIALACTITVSMLLFKILSYISDTLLLNADSFKFFKYASISRYEIQHALLSSLAVAASVFNVPNEEKIIVHIITSDIIYAVILLNVLFILLPPILIFVLL